MEVLAQKSSPVDRPMELHTVVRDGGIGGAMDADDALTGTSATKSGSKRTVPGTCPDLAKSNLLSFSSKLCPRSKAYACPTP